MSESLPYLTKTASGRRLAFNLPLHDMTRSSADVADLLTAVLSALDDAIRRSDHAISDGDVLQSLAMALAVRTRLVEESGGPVHALAQHLLKQQLASPSREETRLS